MALVVTALGDDKYQIELSAPEETWLAMLAAKLVSDKITMLAAAVNFGLIDMFAKYLPTLPVAKKEPAKADNAGPGAAL